MNRFLLTIILLEIPLQLDTYLFHRPDDAAQGAIGGINISVTTLCLGCLLLFRIPTLIKQSKFPDGAQIYIDWWLFTYLVLTGLSIFVAQDRQLATFELCLLAQAFLLHFYLINTLNNREDITYILFILLIGALVQCVVTMYVMYARAGDDLVFGPLKFRVDRNLRAVGSLGSPIVAASFFALLLAPALALTMTPSSRTKKTIAVVGFAMGCVFLILTQSRGAWVAGLISSCAVVWYASRRQILSTWVPVAAVIIFPFLVAIFGGTILDRLTGDDEGSAYSRVELIKLGMNIIADNPLGIGSNNYADVARDYQGRPEFREQWFYTVHNKYVLIAAETGILSLIAFVCFLVFTIRQGWRAAQGSDPILAPLALGLSAAIVGQMLHMLVDIFNSRPQVQLLCLATAVIAACYQIQTRNQIEPCPTTVG